MKNSQLVPCGKINIVGQCLGSASFTLGNTKVECIIKGPFDIRNIEYGNLEIKWKEQTLNKSVEKYFSEIIKSILLKYMIFNNKLHNTNKFYSITFLVTNEKEPENDEISSNLVCAINACIIALLNAGVPLEKMFYASTSFKIDEELFLFENEGDKSIYYHGFGDRKSADMNKVLLNLEDIINEIFICIQEHMDIKMF